MTQWQNSARGGAEREFRGDVIGNYGRASSYGRGMPMEDGYGGGECRTEWGARYGAEPSRAPFYDAAEDESWRPAREEFVNKLCFALHRDHGGTYIANAAAIVITVAISMRSRHQTKGSPKEQKSDSMEVKRRKIETVRQISPKLLAVPYYLGQLLEALVTLSSLSAIIDQHIMLGCFVIGVESYRCNGEVHVAFDFFGVGDANSEEGGVTSVTRDPKESTAKVNKSGDDAEPKKKEVAKIVEEDIEGNADSGARKIASLEKGDKWKDDKDEKRNEEKQGVEHHSEADETFGKIEVGKEEDPAKKIFIRKDFTHDDIHHFVPISMRERGFSKGSSAPHTTKQKRWIDEWKERNAALKAVADAKLSPESGALKQCISASGGGGDETKDVSADADSIGIIDPKDYIEALSNPDFDPPQPDDLGYLFSILPRFKAADLMPKEAEETVKGRRTLLSPPVLAERAEDKAGMGFFSVPVLAGPSMFKAQENTEPERPFKPGLLDPPPRVERPPKPGLLDVRMDAPGLKNGPVSKSDRLVLGGTVAVAMRATVDAIADSLPQRGVLSDAVKRGVTEMLLSNDGFTAEIAKLCKEEVARMLTRGLNAGGRPLSSDLESRPKGIPPVVPGRRTPPRPGGFAYEDSSLPFHWERDGEPCSLGSRRGQGPIDRFCGDRRGYERRPSYDGPRNGPLIDFDGPPRSVPSERYFGRPSRDRSPLSGFDRPHLPESERFGGIPPRREFDEGRSFDRPLSRGEEFGRPWSREDEVGRPYSERGGPSVRCFGGTRRGPCDVRDERDSRGSAPHYREHDFGRWSRPFDEPSFDRRGNR
ncbi:unnamed protein product [Toxocara canis]|uniref:Reverse transcriptase domain-containing protein n=1 Tax=Toxocara canis TaxID=6265 RepID=A0A183ULY9_TOXCA|nr:unnamed protein product [Toxocara canis]